MFKTIHYSGIRATLLTELSLCMSLVSSQLGAAALGVEDGNGKLVADKVNTGAVSPKASWYLKF